MTPSLLVVSLNILGKQILFLVSGDSGGTSAVVSCPLLSPFPSDFGTYEIALAGGFSPLLCPVPSLPWRKKFAMPAGRVTRKFVPSISQCC